MTTQQQFKFSPNIEGVKTAYYKDVKVAVCAGMQFNTGDYKIRKIGYDVFRQYFDTKDMDYQVGVSKIKKVFNY